MGISIKTLQGKEKTTDVDFAGEVAHVKWTPSGQTWEFAEEAQEALEANDITKFAELMASIINDLDVVDEEGNPWPVTAEGLKKLPIEFLSSVFSAMRDDTVGEVTGATSDAG